MLLTEESKWKQCNELKNGQIFSFWYLIILLAMKPHGTVQEVFRKQYRYICLVDLICSDYPLFQFEPNIWSSVELSTVAMLQLNCCQAQVWSFLCCQKPISQHFSLNSDVVIGWFGVNITLKSWMLQYFSYRWSGPGWNKQRSNIPLWTRPTEQTWRQRTTTPERL